jgi:hypothetical protein
LIPQESNPSYFYIRDTPPPQNPLAGEAIATVGQLRDIRRKDTDIRVKVRVVDCRGNTYIPDASVLVDPDLKLCAASSLSSTSITDAFVDLKTTFLLQLDPGYGTGLAISPRELVVI